MRKSQQITNTNQIVEKENLLVNNDEIAIMQKR